MRLSKDNRLKVSVFIMILTLVLQTIVPAFGHVSVAEPMETEEEVVVEEPIVEEPSDIEDEKPSDDDTKEEEQEEITKEEETSEESEIVSDEEPQVEESINTMSDSVPNKLEGIINGVELTTADGKKIDIDEPLDQGTKIKIAYTWQIPDDVIVKSGDYSEVDFPTIFSIHNDVPGILETNEGSAGTFKLDTSGKLRLTFNEFAEDLYGVVGYVRFETEFDPNELKGENPKTIRFPISETNHVDIPVKFEPSGVNKQIEKSGLADKGKNATEITWTIDVNKKLKKIDDAEITDNIPDGLELDVDIEGKVNLGSKDDSKTTQGFPVNLGDITGAYRLVYKTKITDSSKTNFSNTANFDGDSATAGVNTPRGSMIEKNGVANKQFNADKITWTVYVNKSESKITNGVLEDIYGEGLKLDENSVKVYEVALDSNGDEASSSEINTGFTPAHDDTANKLEIIFNGETNKAYKVVYDTEIIDKLETSFRNNAKFEGIPASKDIPVKIGKILEKSGSAEIGYNDDKFINWTIDMNGRELDIVGATLTDVIGEGHELKLGSIEIKEITYNNSGGASYGNNISTPANTTENGTDGFTINLGDTNKAYRITYKTKITDHDTMGTYDNDVTLSGTGVGIGPGGETASKPITPTIKNTFSKNNTGVDYSNNTMSWRIIVNPY